MQIRPTAFTIGLIIHFSIALFSVYTEFGIDSACIVLSYFLCYENAYFPLALSCTIELFVFLFVHKRISNSLFSFASIFFIILNVFHFGQVFICGYWNNLITELRLRIVLNYFEVDDCIKSMRIINISYVSIGFGILYVINKMERQPFENNSMVFQEEFDIRYAYLIIGLSFPIKLVIDVMFFYRSFTIGFLPAVAWLGRFPDYIKAIGDFSMIGFAILIIALKGNRVSQFRVFVLVELYLTMLMISGRRSETVSYIVVIAYIYLKTSQKKKIRVTAMLLYIFGGYILLTFMYTTVRLRELDDRSIEGFFDTYWLLLTKKNIIMEAMREYGNTGYTPVCVLANWLSYYPPSYGKSYLYGITAIFPNIGGIVGNMITESTYAIQLQQKNMVMSGFYNIGGSVIGELFFNFGLFGGVVASPILGALIGKISEKVEHNINNVNNVIYYIPVMYASLYWIRDSFGSGIREVVWGIVFCYLLKYIKIEKRKGKK